MTRWSRLGFVFLLTLGVFLGGAGSAAALSSVDVLIVNDGHTLRDQSLLPDHRFVPTYRRALEPVENVNITVKNVSAVDIGPDREVMKRYDVVIWYTLWDYEGNENCPESGTLGILGLSQDECRTFYGDPTDPDSGGGDIQNITNYLRQDHGRIILTGHKIDFENSRTSFYRNVLKTLTAFEGGPKYYECPKGGPRKDCTQLSKGDISNRIHGEAGDPVTSDQFFTLRINTSIEPKSERGVFMDYCVEEWPLVEDFRDVFCEPLPSQDMFTWKHSNSSMLYTHSYDDDESDSCCQYERHEDWAHSMTRVNTSTYKTVYAGFGFEAIISDKKRQRLMNQSINYLIGPRVDKTTVSDNDNIAGTPVDEGNYANGTVNITSTCMNNQIQEGTHISAAQFWNSHDGIPDVPRNNTFNSFDDGVTLEATDETFGDDRHEPVEKLNWDAGISSTAEEGKNITVAVQCRDTANSQYWGQYEKDWFIFDDNPPEAPDDVSFTASHTNDALANVTVDYALFSEPNRGQLVRFSCDQSNWGDWRAYNQANDVQNFTVNTTASELGCSTADGNRTVHVQARDYAGNMPGTTRSDFIVLDRATPDGRGIDPANGSFIRETTNVTVNATDTLSGVESGAAHLFDNGTLNQSFTINESFDPDWTAAGEQTLVAHVFDRAGNVLDILFRFTVDLAPPTIDTVSPSNDSVVRSTDTITVTVSDETANVSRLAAYNGTAWENFTVNAPQNTTGIDPRWTTEGPHTLDIWVNDSVDRVRREVYHYDVDDSPPAFLSFNPSNGSFIRSDDTVTIDIVDRFAAGVDINVFGRDGVNETFTANQSFSPGWTAEGLHNVTVWSNDTLAHYNTTFLQYRVDDTAPTIDSITPTDTFLNGSGNITITASDAAAGLDLGMRYNGTHNETFQSGTSFDPGWTTEELHTLDIWVNDSVGNMRTDAKTWELDTTAPRFTSVTPANTSFIDIADNITIEAADDASGLSVGRAYNGSHNQSIEEGISFDPGWTASTTHTLQVWFNDTVRNMNRTTYSFRLDALPPSLTSADPVNTSHIRPDKNITVSVTDRGPDGGAGTDIIRASNGTHNQTVASGEDFDPDWSEGVNTLRVFKNDTLGNMNSTFLEYTVDDTPPTTTDDHTFSGWRTSNKTIGINTRDNFGADLISTCTYDNLTAATCTPSVTGVPNVSVNAGCVPGDTCQIIVRYHANDTAGNVEPIQSSANVSIDKEAPDVDFVTPRSGQTVAGTIDLKAAVNDAGVGTDISTDRVQYSIVNRSNDNVVETGLLNRSDFDTNTITTGAATAVFNISAIDEKGNAVNRTNISFTIDNRGVVTNIETPDRTFVNDDFAVDLRALRPGGGVGNMTFNITNSTGFVLNRTTRKNINLERDNFTDTVTINDTNWFDDNLTLQFSAQSNSTPITESFSETWFVLDRLRPNTTIQEQDATWVSGTKQVSYTANATDPWGMDRCRWQYRNSSSQNWKGNFSTDCGVDKQFDFDTTNCQDDADPTCTVRLFGRDQAGNVNSSTVQFRVDNSPPTVSIDTSHAWHNDDFSVAHTESDPQGFTRTYRVNDSTWQPLTNSDITVDIRQQCSVEGSKTCNVSVNATNNVGDTVLASRRYSIDTSPPTIESIAPKNGSNITSEEDIRIDFDASVAGKQTAVFNNGTKNWSFTDATAFDPGWTTEGEHTLTVWVVDKAGNAVRRHLVYTVDDTAPVFLSETPANGSDITPEDTLTVDINDTVTGVAESEFDNGDGINRSFTDATAFDPRWAADGYHWIDLYLADFAGNVNHSALRYFVDGTPPSITLVDPANGSVIRQGQKLTVNASDAGVGIDLARFTNTDTGQTVFFTPNQTFDPGWTSQGRRLFEPVLNDTLNNTVSKRFYFTTDGTPPNINTVETNMSIVAEEGAAEIAADVVENYSSIGLVRANIIDETDSVIDRLTLTRFSGSSTHNTTFTAPAAGTQDLTVNITANDTLRHRRFNTTLTLTVDATPPNATAPRFNVSTDTHFGDTRIYRGAPIAFQVNLTENGAIGTATITVNASSNAASGENYTLSLSQGTVSRGIWRTAITDTDQVGVYNVTRLYLNDTVANHNSTANVPAFRVVNQTLNASLADALSVDAGHTAELNLSVGFNRSRAAPTIQVFIPPAAPGSLVTPSFTNRSAYTCGFGTGCTADPITTGGTVASLNVSTTGSGRNLFVTAPVKADTPAADTNRSWTLRSAGRTQTAETTITAPFLNVSQVFCGADTNCTVTQNAAFSLNVTLQNHANATHSGLANDTQVNISAAARGITNSTGTGTLASGGARNATFQVNLTVAGDTAFDITGFDRLTGAYNDSRQVTVTARDSVPPNSSDRSLGRTLLNPGQSVAFELTAVDNVAVGTVQATVLNTTGPRQNLSLTLDSGDAQQGVWSGRYTDTGAEGRYNITRLYLNDTEGNLQVTPINKRFRVVDFTVNTSLNTSTPAFGGAVRIRSNITGNVTDLSRFSANISKPRGFLENISLERASGVHDFAATYTNISRSGPFRVNTTAVATRLAWNDTATFSAPFGAPSPTPLDGNGTHLVLPQPDSPYTVSWHVTPDGGDLEDVNTTLAIADTGVVDLDAGETNFSFIGNVTAEQGAATVSYNLTDVSTGTTEITLTAKTSRGTAASRTVTVNLSSSDVADPNITGFRDTPGVVNKQQDVTIRTNASDASILENATIVVNHPDTGSNASEPPRRMERVGRGQYRHRFTNTNETGHYTYEIVTWDISGNRDRIVSNSFNVSGTYTVTVTADQSLYRKGEEATFTASVTDVNGDSVPAANMTMMLDRSGSNTTILPNNETDNADYTIRSRDPPGEGASAENLPFTYTLFANVSEDSNTGSAQHRVNVTRLITRDEDILFDNLDQGDNVAPGSEFTVQLDVNYPGGDAVTEAVVFIRCNTCPSDFRFLDHQGDGIYRENFTAPEDDDSLALRVFVDDGLGNSESQEDQAAPLITLDVTEKTGDTGGDGQTGETGDDGGGGGGGIISPSMEIERISPPSQIPPTTDTANLSVRTSDTATCRYGDEVESFGRATPFTETGGRLHYALIGVQPGTSYNYRIFCQTPDNTTVDRPVAFSVQSQEFATYSVQLPSDVIAIPQGANESVQVTVLNNGTRQIGIGLGATSDCCRTRFTDLAGNSIGRVLLAAGEGRVVNLFVDVPLHEAPGRKGVIARFTRENRTRAGTVTVNVQQSQYIQQLEALRDRSQELQRTIEAYRASGIDTAALEAEHAELQDTLDAAVRAVQQDDRDELRQRLSSADEEADSIQQRLDILGFQQYIRTHWWQWLIGAAVFYLLFVLLTMVAIPYYRLRTEYLNVQDRLENAVEARRKAEKQYFRREIDRSTFMNIMTERQDEILEMRGERDELEEELEHAVRKRLTLENFVKAPVKAVREISRWWQARASEEKEEE